MNIREILKQGENALFVVSGNDLKEFAESVVNGVFASLQYEPVHKENDGKMYTANEVCELFHIDKSTLWRWEKVNYLVPIRVGAKRFYLDEDVKKLSNSK